jgi:hypothetical protein
MYPAWPRMRLTSIELRLDFSSPLAEKPPGCPHLPCQSCQSNNTVLRTRTSPLPSESFMRYYCSPQANQQGTTQYDPYPQRPQTQTSLRALEDDGPTLCWSGL